MRDKATVPSVAGSHDGQHNALVAIRNPTLPVPQASPEKRRTQQPTKRDARKPRKCSQQPTCMLLHPRRQWATGLNMNFRVHMLTSIVSLLSKLLAQSDRSSAPKRSSARCDRWRGRLSWLKGNPDQAQKNLFDRDSGTNVTLNGTSYASPLASSLLMGTVTFFSAGEPQSPGQKSTASNTS